MGGIRLILKSKSFLVLLAYFVVAFGSQQLLGWPVVRVWGASPWGYGISADLQSVLNASDCFKNAPFGAFFEVGAGSCKYIYGNFLIVSLNFLGLGASSTGVLSWIFIGGVACAFAYLATQTYFYVRTIWARIAIALALSSPPIALLLERANFDALIFLLTLAGLIFLQNRKVFISVALIAAAALMKFYAMLGFAIFALTKLKKWQQVLVASTFLGALAEVSAEVFIRKPAVPMDIGGAFGSYSIGLWFNFSTAYLKIPFTLSNVVSLSIGIGVLVLGVFCSFVYLKRADALKALNFNLSGSLNIEHLGAGMAPIYLGCYVLGTNFDYRLVFFLPFALAVIAKSEPGKLRNAFLALFVGAMWLSYNSGVFGQVLGDIVMGLWASFAILSVFLTIINVMPVAFRSKLPLFVKKLDYQEINGANH